MKVELLKIGVPTKNGNLYLKESFKEDINGKKIHVTYKPSLAGVAVNVKDIIGEAVCSIEDDKLMAEVTFIKVKDKKRKNAIKNIIDGKLEITTAGLVSDEEIKDNVMVIKDYDLVYVYVTDIKS
jgi:hypothetical protein